MTGPPPPPEHPKKHQRLGRGLEALLGSLPSALQPGSTGSPAAAPDAAPTSAQPQSIPVAAVKPNPSQPRRHFKDTDLEELAASIAAHGLLQPILVRPTAGGFELVAGERRLRAVAKLGWKSVPAIVRAIEDRHLLTVALVENLQRTDLNPIEEAEGYQQLISDLGLTQQQIAEAVAKDRSTVANALRLLQLPTTIRAMLVGGQLTMGHARALLAIPEEGARIDLARQAVARGYTVRDLERLAKSSTAPATEGEEKSRGSQRSSRTAGQTAQLHQITDAIRRHLQTDVRVESEDGVKGEIRIRFYSPDDLERILDRMVGAARGPN